MAKSINWTCEYRECDIAFKRYQVYVDRGTKKYCCQSHATLEQNLIDRDNGGRVFKEKTIICVVCNREDSSLSIQKKYCKECHRILACIRGIKKNHTNLQDFSPLDYYVLLKSQNNKCGICNVEKCATGNSFAIDHNHVTGEVRGLLCLSCNVKIGWLERKKTSVEQYIKNYNKRRDADGYAEKLISF